MLLRPLDFPGKNTGVGCHFFSYIYTYIKSVIYIFKSLYKASYISILYDWSYISTQGLNPGLPHCRPILYQLSHKGSPRILEWVAYPFSSESSWPRNQTRVSCIAGGFFTNWAIREAPINTHTHTHIYGVAILHPICWTTELWKVKSGSTHHQSYKGIFPPQLSKRAKIYEQGSINKNKAII